MTTQEIKELRKAGHLEEALQAAEELFSQSANGYTLNALLWCLYEIVKQQNLLEASRTYDRMCGLYQEYAIGDSFIGNCLGWAIFQLLHKTPVDKSRDRKILLKKYLDLNLPRPSDLHSTILGEAVKVENDTPLEFRIRDFIRLWGLENLRNEDWEQYKSDNGHTSPSTVERFIDVYAKELQTDGVPASEECCRLIDQALERFPSNQNLPLSKCYALLSLSKKDEAIDCYRKMILKNPSKFYLLDQLADLVDDDDLKMGLLCKSIAGEQDDGFAVKRRLKLIDLLIAKDGLPNARYELECYRNTYISKGWVLKREFYLLFNKLQTVDPTPDNSGLYAEFIPKVEEFLYSTLPSRVMIKVSDAMMDDHNRPGRKFLQWTLRYRSEIFRLRKPAKFGLDKNTPNGSVFEVKVQDNKIVWIKPYSDVISEDWVKTATGVANLRKDRNGRTFAIVSGVYVGEKLLRNVTDGQSISLRAIRQEDGRWSAIAIV